MSPSNIELAEADDRVLVISRIFDAPRSLVFKVWTQPEHMARWWGPRDFTVPSIKADVRPGGTYRACLRAPDGTEHWVGGVYRDIVPPERLVFTWAWEDAALHDGPETLVTVTFAEENGKTRLTFRQAAFASVETRDSHRDGWSECFERLADYLATTDQA